MENTGVIKIRTAADRGLARKRYMYYPVDEIGFLVAELIGTPTIRNVQLMVLQRLGYKIIYVGRKDTFLERIGAIYEGESFVN